MATIMTYMFCTVLWEKVPVFSKSFKNAQEGSVFPGDFKSGRYYSGDKDLNLYSISIYSVLILHYAYKVCMLSPVSGEIVGKACVIVTFYTQVTSQKVCQ